MPRRAINIRANGDTRNRASGSVKDAGISCGGTEEGKRLIIEDDVPERLIMEDNASER